MKLFKQLLLVCGAMTVLANQSLWAQTTPSGVVVWVTNANDSGTGSLRAAIESANASSASDTIKFNIPATGIIQILVGSSTGLPLPTITGKKTIIDATTQTGFGVAGNYTPLIHINGDSNYDNMGNDWTYPHDGLTINADSCEVYGLVVKHFADDGIRIINAKHAKIGA
nr:hypothetical protein [Saprospiraceae bacterium]